MEKAFEKVAVNEKHKNWMELIKRQEEIYSREDDVRSPFVRDYTRVLHSLAYRRLKHKTQVFFNAAGNDHICTRIEHVAHVESVATTVSKALGLNDELASAIAISHDLGHAPFGHLGERVITKLSEAYLGKKFWHEQNGVHFVDNVELLKDNENKLKNLNLTYAVRDGIISHCGELDNNSLCPRDELFDLSEFDEPGKYEAATWEGCVVKLADKISYLGRDIEDALRLHYFDELQQEKLQKMARIYNEKALNTTVIMHNMIIDLCHNSSPDKGLCLSKEMSDQLDEIKAFNYEAIYKNKRLQPFSNYASLIINQLFDSLMGFWDEYVEEGKKSTGSVIELIDKKKFGGYNFVKNFAEKLAAFSLSQDIEIDWVKAENAKCCNKKIYGDLSKKEQYVQAVIDYIAGMTDTYAISSFEELLQC